MRMSAGSSRPRGPRLNETVILLSSDHGFFLGEHTFYDKRLMYEPSIRVPMMIRYPELIAAGTVRDEMVLNIDAPVTLLDVVGIEAPATIQGRSFLPLARGHAVPDWRTGWLYEYYEYPGVRKRPAASGCTHGTLRVHPLLPRAARV